MTRKKKARKTTSPSKENIARAKVLKALAPLELIKHCERLLRKRGAK